MHQPLCLLKGRSITISMSAGAFLKPSQSPAKVVVPSQPGDPLSDELRHDLLNGLISQNAVSGLRAALSESCQAANWQKNVETRAMALLRSGGIRSIQQLETQIIAEALGRTICNGEVSNEAVKESRTDGKKEMSKGDSANTDIKVPDQAITNGTAAVRKALDAIVVVDDKDPARSGEESVWKDWR